MWGTVGGIGTVSGRLRDRTGSQGTHKLIDYSCLKATRRMRSWLQTCRRILGMRVATRSCKAHTSFDFLAHEDADI